MGFCPFMSWKQKTFVLNSATSPDSEYTHHYYESEAGFDSSGRYNCPQSADCQIWDATNSQCGMLTSTHAKSIDDGVGTLHTDLGTTLHNDLTAIDGHVDEVEGKLTTLSANFDDVVGTSDELDRIGTDSLVTYFQNILGKYDDLDLIAQHRIGSVLKLMTHFHTLHSHGWDPTHVHQSISIMAGMLLVSEFVGGQDSDGKDLSELGAAGSIFGQHFMITNDANCPPVVKQIYKHPDWSDPPVSISWSDYVEAPYLGEEP